MSRGSRIRLFLFLLFAVTCVSFLIGDLGPKEYYSSGTITLASIDDHNKFIASLEKHMVGDISSARFESSTNDNKQRVITYKVQTDGKFDYGDTEIIRHIPGYAIALAVVSGITSLSLLIAFLCLMEWNKEEE